jgi:hypothetical protein
VNVVEVAAPLALVVSASTFVPFANVPLAPDEGAVNVTVAPLTGFWLLSSTVATRGAPNAELGVESCKDPLVAAIDAGGPEVFVRLKLTVAVVPATKAVTVLAPSVPLAVKVDEVTTPLALVVSVSVFVEVDANVPLAPVAGAVKTTNAPLTGCPPIVTVATNGAANGVLSAVVCGVPLFAAIDSSGEEKLDELQFVNKGNARKTKPSMPGRMLRFIATHLSGPFSGRHACVPAATPRYLLSRSADRSELWGDTNTMALR